MELKSFTRNYEDNSTSAGYQFTFYCDICNNGYKSSFVESTVYKKKSKIDILSQGASVLGGFLGGIADAVGGAIQGGSNILSQKFEDQSPQWQKEHEKAFNEAQEEVKKAAHFRKCPGCNLWVCPDCFNEEEGMCTECTPRESVLVTKAKSKAIQNNIDEAAESSKIWKGKLETKTIICPGCGEPAGNGKFCNNCGASLATRKCKKCGADVPNGVKFCGECGTKYEEN